MVSDYMTKHTPVINLHHFLLCCRELSEFSAFFLCVVFEVSLAVLSVMLRAGKYCLLEQVGLKGLREEEQNHCCCIVLCADGLSVDLGTCSFSRG